MATEEKDLNLDTVTSSDSDTDTDSDDELARTRIPDDDPQWQKVTFDNGVKKIILKEGWGKAAPDGSDAYIRYIGKFKDSQRVFEDNTKLNPPFKFLVGHFRVIRAIDLAVANMKIGEKCLLRSSSRYAFGEKGEGRKIAPNKDLDYELQVIDWNDWKRVNNHDEVRKRVLLQGEGDMYDVPDASAICDITYSAQIFEEDEKYPSDIFSCARHIDFQVNEDPTFPKGFHEAIKSMNKYESAEFKIEAAFGFGDRGVSELNIAPNATLYYRVIMHNYQNLMSRWKMEPLQLFDVAKRFKNKARQYYEIGNWDYALNRYEKALEYFEADEKMDAEEKKQAQDDIAIVHNNLAMIYLKKNQFIDCIRECNKVLKHNTSNIKAWCRRGQSQMMLADYKKASEDLKTALALDPNNRYIKRIIKINRNKKKTYQQNQKKLYGGMFDRYQTHLKEKAKQKKKEQKINYGDIDDYNEDNESEMSIDFDFDDMDQEETIASAQNIDQMDAINEDTLD